MSYETILAGLHRTLATVTPPIAVLLDYEPTAIHTTPTLYSLLDTVTRERAGQVVAVRYRILNRLVFRWQDNEQAERELIPYVNAVAMVLDTDPHMDGAMASGMASINQIDAVFVSIGGTVYRTLDIYVDALEKAPVGSI